LGGLKKKSLALAEQRFDVLLFFMTRNLRQIEGLRVRGGGLARKNAPVERF
jgi:hypothetical protein